MLAVYGDLTMWNVTVESGYSQAEAIAGGTHPYTLARGGGLAVWGTAQLYDCDIIGNTCEGESGSARDRGTYGGGIYANGLDLNGVTRTVRVDAATAVVAGAITNGVSTNAAGVVKVGAGRLLLAATNAYDGPTTLAGGTLALAGDEALGRASSAASTGLRPGSVT